MDTTPQERLWTEFYQAKVHACYLELVLARTRTWDLVTTIGAAILCGGVVAGFSFWKRIDPTMGGVLSVGSAGGSIAAVRKYLPYSQRAKALGALANDYHTHVTWIEKKCSSVANMADEDAVVLREEFQTKLQKADYKHFPDSHVPDIPKLMRKATANANTHFKNFYGSTVYDYQE